MSGGLVSQGGRRRLGRRRDDHWGGLAWPLVVRAVLKRLDGA
jgi:hypothetical protein